MMRLACSVRKVLTYWLNEQPTCELMQSETARLFQLRRKRTDGRLHSVAFMEPEGCAVKEFGEAGLQLALCHVLMADAVTLQLREGEFLFRCQFGIEQWLPVLVLLGAGM